MKIGTRKFTAFLVSLGVYFFLFFLVLAYNKVEKGDIPSFALNLGMGLSVMNGAFYAGNVLAKTRSNDNAK
jgi:hypothetical protein